MRSSSDLKEVERKHSGLRVRQLNEAFSFCFFSLFFLFVCVSFSKVPVDLIFEM